MSYCSRWSGRYTGPGNIMLAIPVTEKVCDFTDHSFNLFLKDGTPCESIILDNSFKDAGLCKSDICL